jgi:hypothetical protein
MELLLFLFIIYSFFSFSFQTYLNIVNISFIIYLISNFETKSMSPLLIIVKTINLIINLIKLQMNFNINYYINNFKFLGYISYYYGLANRYFVWCRGYLFKRFLLNPIKSLLNIDLLNSVKINKPTFKTNMELNEFLDDLIQ